MRNRFSVLRYIDTPEDIAVPVIDAVPLYKRLTERYAGLAVRLVVPPSRQWLGSPQYAQQADRPHRNSSGQPARAETQRAVILDGTCGYADCCGVMAMIDVTPTTVVWRDFLARGHPPIPDGLRFEFDRKEYESALAGLDAARPLEWTDEHDSRK